MRIIRRLMTVLAGIALLPLLAILVTAAIAGVAGCEVNEGGPMPCVVYGTDIGGSLSSLMVTGWFGLMTIPLLMLLVAVWALLEAYVWNRQSRKLRRAARESTA